MNKFKGKALSLVLSLALVISSFSAVPASASTKTLKGDLSGTFDTDFYLVNGGSGTALEYSGFGTEVSSDVAMTTERHEDVSDLRIASVSHKSGDRLTKFYDSSDDDSIDSDTDISNVTLKLRSSTVSGEEVVSILYVGTFTDEDDKEYNVKATKDVTIRVYNKGETVIGEANTADGAEGELDDSFAQKTLAHEMDSTKPTDNKLLTVLQAVPSTSNPIVVSWNALNTAVYDNTTKAYLNANDTTNTDDVAYLLKSSSDNLQLTQATTGGSPSECTGVAAANIDVIGVAYNAENNTLTVTPPTNFTTGDKIYSSTTAAIDTDNPGTDTEILAADDTKVFNLGATAVTYYFAYYKAADTNTVVATATAAYTPASAGTSNGTVVASVKNNSGTGNITLTAEATKVGKAIVDSTTPTPTYKLYSTSDVKEKTSITKKIKVDSTMVGAGYVNLGKLGTNTYIYKGTLDSTNTNRCKVNGFEVKFDGGAIQVDDKANVSKISGTVTSINIASGNVGSIALSDTGSQTVTISGAKVGDVDFGSNGGTLSMDSSDASVGNVTDATTINVTGGTAGSLEATTVTVKADDDEHAVSVGDITASSVEIDSEDSKASVGTITASAADSVITLHGTDVTVKGVDFDYYNAQLSLEDFQGNVPAPVKADADGATISTEDADDSVVITGSADINSVSVAEDSTMKFTDSATIGSIDGSGTLVVGVNKLYVTSSASGVLLKLDGSFAKNDVAFTSVSDTVDEDDMDLFGFTVKKTEGSAKDTFKVDSTEFVGLTVAPATAEIAKGESQTFTASSYAPGTSIPAGYTVKYSLDGDSDIFDVTDNGNGTAKVTVADYEDTFLEENSATLVAELVDADGDVDEDYAPGNVTLKAVKTPAVAFTSDTAVKNMKVGESYRFRITSADGSQPSNFVVASNAATVTYRGNSGKDYFYDVKAVKTGSYGVYVAGPKLAVLNITNAFTIDTKTVSVNAGASYQFKVTGPSQPRFQVAGVGDIKLTSKSGNNYFFKVTVPSNLAKGGHGVYVNGVAMAVVTVK